ncbi:MAG: phosphonoacetaldehyde hydrolase [Desulfovibrio sp.]|nr:phosphonoacetaldehyde hydrolase [Desulfovibrio sp.]
MSENNSRGIRGVILDWAGTSVDCGCRGPAAVFARAFEDFGVSPTIEEIRGPMGMEKREHVRTMLATPRLAALWEQRWGKKPDDKDIDNVFGKVQALMPDVLADYAKPVPGCVEAIDSLRAKGIKIGSCTGYRKDMMSRLIPAAREAGFSPDCLVTADEVPEGRPMPWMCQLNCMRLNLFPPESIVKVGDTIADIQEGVRAGHWSVGVTRTSNALGYSEEELQKEDPEVIRRKEEALAKEFRGAGAHYVIGSIADLPELCDEISLAMTNGRRP